MPEEPTIDAAAELTDALVVASRALVGVAARSLAGVDTEVTLPQFRALVVLAAGPRRVGELAEVLGVHPSTATRLCDRLVERRLVRRAVDRSNRRETIITLSARGRSVVDRVTTARRREIRPIVERIPPHLREPAVAALVAFATAAGEPAPEAGSLGWS